MPTITGYAGGYLHALTEISGVEEIQSQIAARNHAMQQAARHEQRQQYMFNNDIQTRNILSQAFQTQQTNSNILDRFGQEEATAQQYRNAGKAILATDPKTGLSLLGEGDRLMNQTQQQRYATARIEMLKQDRLASLAGMVGDQDSLDQYTMLAAQQGHVIPEEFRVWGPATERWLERQTFMAGPTAKAASLALRVKQLELNKAREERQVEKDRQMTMQRERLDAQKQAGIAAKAISQSYPRGELSLLEETKSIAAADETGQFGKLPQETKRTAVQDMYLIADQLARENPGADLLEIKAEAQRRILSKVVPGEGWLDKPTYTSSSKGAVSKEPASMVVEGVTYTRRADGRYYPEK